MSTMPFDAAPPDDMTPIVQPALTARYACAKRKRDAIIAQIKREIAETSPRARVLVVEDAAEVAHLLAEVLRDEAGVDVDVAVDPVRALEIARSTVSGDYAAALIDLHLNHSTINGLTVAAALPRGVCVYMVSGVMPQELAEAGRRVSAEAVFEKPLGVPQLGVLCAAVRERVGRDRRGTTTDSVH